MELSLPLTLVPSLPAESFAQLDSLAEKLAGVTTGFQIDIVDGVFAPHTSWPFSESDVQTELQKITTLPSSLSYELDCMVSQPEQYLDLFLSLPLQTVIIHYGSTENYDHIFTHLKAGGKKVGLAFTSDAALDEIDMLICKVDLVQVMGIREVGKQGQPFDERTVATIEMVRKKYPKLSIAVDGGVNAETIPRLRAAGANHFAPGSAISKSNDPVVAYKQLFTLLT